MKKISAGFLAVLLFGGVFGGGERAAAWNFQVAWEKHPVNESYIWWSDYISSGLTFFFATTNMPTDFTGSRTLWFEGPGGSMRRISVQYDGSVWSAGLYDGDIVVDPQSNIPGGLSTVPPSLSPSWLINPSGVFYTDANKVSEDSDFMYSMFESSTVSFPQGGSYRHDNVAFNSIGAFWMTIYKRSVPPPAYVCYFRLYGTYFVDPCVTNKNFVATVCVADNLVDYIPLSTFVKGTSGRYVFDYGPYDISFPDALVKIVGYRWIVSSQSMTNEILGDYKTEGSLQPSGHYYSLRLNLNIFGDCSTNQIPDPSNPTNQIPIPDPTNPTNQPPPIPPGPTNGTPTNFPNPPWPDIIIYYPDFPSYPYSGTNYPNIIPNPYTPTNSQTPGTNPAVTTYDFYSLFRHALEDEGNAYLCEFPSPSNLLSGTSLLFSTTANAFSNGLGAVSNFFGGVDRITGAGSTSLSNLVSVWPKNVPEIGTPLYKIDLVLPFSTIKPFTEDIPISFDLTPFQTWVGIFRMIIKWSLYVLGFFCIVKIICSSLGRVS